MAASTAAAAIFVLLDSAVFPANVLAFASEIIFVTGSAVGCVLGPGVYERAVDATAVAAAATRVVSVVAGVVPLRVMAEVGRRPACCYVAAVALHRCRQVILRLEGRSTALTVAVVACARRTTVVKPRATDEGSRGMTGVAIQWRRYVVGMHTNCRRSVVTRSAIVDNAGMVETRGDKCASIVANAAVLAGS